MWRKPNDRQHREIFSDLIVLPNARCFQSTWSVDVTTGYFEGYYYLKFSFILERIDCQKYLFGYIPGLLY